MLNRHTPPPIQPTSLDFRKPVQRVLRNGIPLHVIEAGQLDAVRIDFVFSAGQWHQEHKLQALFACRMLREGCRGYTSAEFAERLDYYGAWLDLSVAMNRTFVTLYTLKKHFATTLELVHRMLTEPTYSEEQFRIVCDNNKAQLMVNLQKGDVQAMRALRRSLYGEEHPCGKQVTPEDYDALQLAHVVDFYHRHYGSRTCRIYLSGDVDDTLLSRVESLFGMAEWGSGEKIRNEELGIRNSQPSTLNLQLSTAVQDSIRMGYLLIDVNHPDYLPLRVLTAVLGGYFGSRLMKNIREEKGYTYHIGSDLVTNTTQVMFLIHCEAQAGKAEEVIGEVHREMLRLQSELIPDDELRMVRNYMIGEICRNYESAFSLTDAYIFMEHLGLPLTHLEQTIDAIRTTDAPRLQQLAQRYLRPDMLHTVVVGC
jgi:predicted Zn-dependent peptidase